LLILGEIYFTKSFYENIGGQSNLVCHFINFALLS